MKILIIRVDGTEETVDIPWTRLAASIGATSFDTVNLFRNPEILKVFPTMRKPVMLVDDEGYETQAIQHAPNRIEIKPTRARKPVNPRATFLYHAVCKPGTTHEIVGDVAIVDDEDCA